MIRGESFENFKDATEPESTSLGSDRDGTEMDLAKSCSDFPGNIFSGYFNVSRITSFHLELLRYPTALGSALLRYCHSRLPLCAKNMPEFEH